MAQRGRKKGSDGEQSRALLLRIAAEEFARHGYHETKISSIVKKANVTQPTFYLYFKSKESVFEELEGMFHQKLSHLIAETRLKPGLTEPDVPEKIKEQLADVFRFFSEQPHLSRIGFYISSKAYMRKEALAAQIEENLVFETQSGYFYTKADLTILSHGLVGMIEQLTMARLWAGQNTPEELADEMVEVLLYGLKKKQEVRP